MKSKKNINHLFSFFILLTLVGCSDNSQENKDSFEKPVLTDKNSTTETKALFVNLKRVMEKGTMFGHQDDLSYGVGWKEKNSGSDVFYVTGDYPAVVGWELGNLELGDSCNLDSVCFNKMREHIKATWENGGFTTISWHTNNILTGGNAWDISSSTVVKSILPGGENHDKYNLWLAKLADFFKSLKDDKNILIPVVFRPYHELSGSWFWWGKDLCSPEEYKKLWQTTVSFLKDTQQVHNLIYIYSTDIVNSKEEYMERYPGDEFVDGFGVDIYHRKGKEGTGKYIEDVKRCLKIVSEVADKKNKLKVFSETGCEGIPVENWWTEVLWKTIEPYKLSYVLVWRNAHNIPNHYYAPYPGHSSAENFKLFEKLPGTLFQKDLKILLK